MKPDGLQGAHKCNWIILSRLYDVFVAIQAPCELLSEPAFPVSRSILANRNPRAVVAYIILATVVTIATSGLYLKLFRADVTFSPVVMAIGVTAFLLAAVGLCAGIWRSDTNDL